VEDKMKITSILFMVMVIAAGAFAADIVTVPTANQLKMGQTDAAYYYIGLDLPSAAPQYIQAQTAYIGLTNKVELDVHRYQPQRGKDKSSTVVNSTYLLLSETAVTPAVVVGVRNLAGEKTTNNPTIDSKKRSWYISAAKNITPMLPNGPVLPLIRIHASFGTADNTLLGEKRHEGLFGGVQALLTPKVGAIALYDGQDTITGLTFTPSNKGLTIKGGTFGKHWWAGISFAKSM
jgi:hypothetical protein